MSHKLNLLARGFSVNGHAELKGVVEVQENGELTGQEWSGNLSSVKQQHQLAQWLHEVFEIPFDDAMALVKGLIKELQQRRSEADQQSDDDNPDDGGKKSQATQLVDLATDCELWHTPEGNPFVTIEAEGHKETWGTHTKAFRGWLSNRFYRSYGKSPGAQAIYDALSVLDGQALYEGQEHQVYIRVAEVADAIYIDLANDAWEAVRITASGWEVISDAPVRFRRPRGMLPLPTPVKAGSVHRLRALLNVSQDTDDDWALFLGCLMQALRGEGPTR
jgi:hypothetical protein